MQGRQLRQEAANAQRQRQTHTTATNGNRGGGPGDSPGFGLRLAAHRAGRLVAPGLRQDEELPERLLLGRRRGDDPGGARPRGGDLRGARCRRPIVLRNSSSGKREAGRGRGERGGRGREERGAAVVHAEGEPREEDERDEDPAERPHRRRRRGMLGLARRRGRVRIWPELDSG